MVVVVSFAAFCLLIVGAALTMTAVYKPPSAPERSEEWYRRNWRLGLSLMALSVLVWVVGRLIAG